MVRNTFLLGLVTLVSPLLVSAGVLPIHNCSGEAAPAPATYQPYFSSYGPQLTQLGWEEWTFVLPDTLNQSMFHFRWTRGDPATPLATPLQTATFSVVYPKTGFAASIKGPLEVNTVPGTSMSISVGGNSLSFDGTKGPFGLWNVTININKLQMSVLIDPVTPDVPFEPALNGEKELLVPGYYVSHPIYRGHTDGFVILPTGETWVTRQVATLKHVFGSLPVQSLMSTYARASAFIGPNTLNWYLAKPESGKATTAGHFVFGALDLSEIVLKYETTNEPSILNIVPSATSQPYNYVASFAGCSDTSNQPYTFNSTSTVLLGAIPDSAGGKTEYWFIDTHVSFYIDGQQWTNNATVGSLGLLEVYTSPKL